MSRVGLSPIVIPDGVDVRVAGREVVAKGSLGELSMTVTDSVSVDHADGQIRVSPRDESKRSRALWGTTRSLLNNIVEGVSRGFERRLQISGVGYRAQLQGEVLVLQLGYSHEVRYPVPDGITIAVPSQTEIVVTGIDRQKVGQTAAVIRAFRKPEPYKGKGIRYSDEIIVRKEGKKK